MTSTTLPHPPLKHRPRALLFDVFGTVVNWRSTVTRTLWSSATLTLQHDASIPAALRERAQAVDWPAFAQAWRRGYKNFTHGHTPSDAHFTTVDEHYLASLWTLLRGEGLVLPASDDDSKKSDGSALWTTGEIEALGRVWHELDPWPDSPAGIKALNALGIETTTLSNGNVSLLRDMAAYAGLAWRRILSAEMFAAYKPRPEVYQGAVRELGLQGREGEVAMVAAHLMDLEAARKCGLRTIYIERTQEEEWPPEKVEQAREWVDVWIPLGDRGLVGMAEKLKELDWL